MKIKKTLPPQHLMTGAWAENKASKYLQAQGIRLVQANYHSPFGEIDLIMEDDNGLIFVEVRFRNSARFGSAAESVNLKKQSKLRATAEHYRQRHPDSVHRACRFDVFAITRLNHQDEFNWIINAF